jgi:hypothetical protein
VTFNEVLSQTIAMLQQHGRVSYRALKRQFAIDDAFLEDLKYELIAVGGLTRFVGRETELAALVQALERAGSGHGHVVAVVGEAGVGKLRLVYECVHAHHKALALADELGMRPLQAHCHFGLGTLYATVGQRAQVRTALTTAIEMYRAMGMTFWLPQVEAAPAQVC